MLKTRHHPASIGYTLVEVMIAVVITSVALVTSLSALQFHRIESRKAEDQKVMLEFMEKYLEFARARPFNDIAVGNPINPLFDGTAATPLPTGGTATINIRFPAANTWVNLNTANYTSFHPGLVFMTNRQPQFQCNIATQNNALGVARCRSITMTVRWRPPFNTTRWQTLTASTLVYTDFY